MTESDSKGSEAVRTEEKAETAPEVAASTSQAEADSAASQQPATAEQAEQPDSAEPAAQADQPEPVAQAGQPEPAEAAPAGTSPAEEAAAAPDAVPQPPKKKLSPKARKAVGISLAAVLVIAAGIGAFAIWNGQIDGQLKALAVDELRESGLVEQTEVESAWQDQTGFEPGTIAAKKVDRPFGQPQATVEVEAEAANGLYDLTLDYDVRLEERDGQWALAGIDLADMTYWPSAPIPDEALAANLPAILAVADEQRANLDSPWPRTFASTFGPGTEVTITKNDFAQTFDNVTMDLSSVCEGIPCEGSLDLTFRWTTATTGKGDWDLSLVDPSHDAYGALGSIPHEGLYSFATAEEVEEASSLSPAWGAYWIRFSEGATFRHGAKYAEFSFENIPGNSVDLAFTITLNDTGQVVYESPRLWPNSSIDAIRLNTDLEPGTYSATVATRAYDCSTGQLVGDATDDLTIAVL